MAPYLFVLILCLFDSIYSTKNKTEISQYISKFEIEDSNFSNNFNIKKNIGRLTKINEGVKEFIINIIESYIYLNESELYNMIKKNRGVIIFLCKSLFNENKNQFMADIISDFLSETNNNTLLNDSIHIMTNKSNNVSENLLQLLKADTLNTSYILSHLKYVFINDEFFDFYNNSYLRYREHVMNFVELIVYELNNTNLTTIFNSLKDFFGNHSDDLYIFVYDMIKFYGKRIETVEKIRVFINYNAKYNSKLFQDLKQIIDNKNKTKEILDAFFRLNSLDVVGINVIYELILNTDLMNFIFEKIYNETFVNGFAKIIKDLYTPNFYSSVKGMLEVFVVNNKTNLDLFLNVSVTMGKNFAKKDNVSKFLRDSAIKGINDVILQFSNKYSIVSEDCKNLLISTYINESIVDDDGKNKFPSIFFLKKLILESSLNKNDFLSYENCLNSHTTFSNKTQNQSDIKPVFIIGILQDYFNETIFRDSIFYEKFNYLQSFCLPQGKNISTNQTICSQKDYSNLTGLFSEVAFNVSYSSIEALIFDKEKITKKSEDYTLLIIILIILFFPLIIKFFLFPVIYKCLSAKDKEKTDIINKLTNRKDEKQIKNLQENQLIKNENKNNQFENPKWYHLLNKYFDIVNNLKELFNISLSNTEYNNYNGISYIKGILGISLILNIIGQTFFILMNILIKTITITGFYETISNFLYIFIFIGLRYSPRLIFSCSGYTFSYKYLSFIEYNSNVSFFKFLLFQSHKYILLIIVSIFMRYALYYVNIIFHSNKNPIFELFKSRLEKFDKNYFANLFSFLFYNLSPDEFENKENTIQFLYLPINEVFFFIFGVALISFGYKCKIRIDIIIIFLILVILIAKLIGFLLYAFPKQLYPTLYFYSFGYGSFMLNPLYNLPCFLIGMFFGLVNFTIHRGANINGYSKIELLF